MDVCKICGKEKDDDLTKDGYYHKECYRKKYHTGITRSRKNEWEPPTYYNQILEKPGKFVDAEQKKYVHDILKSIGWKQSPKGHWYDNKIRDIDGKWLKELKNIPMKTKSVPSKYMIWLEERELGIPRVRYELKDRYFTDEQVDQIQKEYFFKHYTVPYLSFRYQCDEKEIKYIIHRTYKLIQNLQESEKIGKHKNAT